MLSNTIKFMMSLHSKKLVQSSMLLRPQHNRNVKLLPKHVQKLVRMTQAPQPLAFKIHKSTQQISFDLPHPKPLGLLQELPFNIERTFSGNLPVYVDYKSRRIIKRTIIRRITGDVQQLANQIRKVVSNAEVRVKVGQIVIPGIHKESTWLLIVRRKCVLFGCDFQKFDLFGVIDIGFNQKVVVAENISEYKTALKEFVFLTIFLKRIQQSFLDMSKTLQSLVPQLKRARNLTYYGKYSQSIEQFQQIKQKIQAQIFHITDKMLLTQWNKLLDQIKYQINLIQATCQMLTGKVDVNFPSKQSKQNENFDANIMVTNNNSSKRIPNNYAKQDQGERKPKMPFGKQPFKKRIHEDDQVYNRKQKQRRKEEEEEQKRYKQHQQKSDQKPQTPTDDDVWDQIFPKQKPQQQKQFAKKPAASGPIVNPAKLNKNPSLVGNDAQRNRQYEKPWKQNAKVPGSDKNQNNPDEKKTFLKSVYPDGNGPDSNLIEALERQVVELSPNVTFDNIAELTKAKQILEEAVLLPLAMPHIFVGNRRAWKGVLLFGPPGTGKTLLAKAVASTGATTFFNVSASSIASKWRGESEKMIRLLFEMARFYAPTTIFIDEIDSVASARGEKQDQASRKVKTQLMTRIDGCTTGSQDNKLITVIGATNRPWDLDEAIRRRLQKRIYIPLPTQVGRRQLLRICLQKQRTQNIDIEEIVRRTQGYSGADIANLCRQAAFIPMRKKLRKEGGLGKKLVDASWKEQFQKQVNIPLTMQEFNQALKNVKPSVGQGELQNYQKWMDEFGQQGTK